MTIFLDFRARRSLGTLLDWFLRPEVGAAVLGRRSGLQWFDFLPRWMHQCGAKRFRLDG
jgi:hypothetical protein